VNHDWLKHAFAIDPPGAVQPNEAERNLVERVCLEIVRRRLSAPALLLLEMSRPLNYVSAQFLHFVHPFLTVVGAGTASEQLARFLEHRGALEYVADRLEQAEARRAETERSSPGTSAAPPPPRPSA